MTTNQSVKISAFLKPLAYLGLAISFAASAGIASAQTSGSIQLKDVQGKVMVNTGSGFVAGNSGMVLKPGYKVMLSDKSQAKIVYANNCTQALKSNSLIKVGAGSECQTNMFDEKSFTKNAAIGDGVLTTTPKVATPVLVWSASLGIFVASTSNTNNNSNQSPNASAL